MDSVMSVFSRFFGKAGGQELSFIEAQRTVLDYARHMEDRAPMPGRIADVTVLPHPKETIKSALIMCIAHNGEPRMQDHLKAGYLMLSAYQQDVGEQMLGVNFAELDLQADPSEVAALINAQSGEASHWDSKVRAELQELQQDLHTLELELSPTMPLSA